MFFQKCYLRVVQPPPYCYSLKWRLGKPPPLQKMWGKGVDLKYTPKKETRVCLLDKSEINSWTTTVQARTNFRCSGRRDERNQRTDIKADFCFRTAWTKHNISVVWITKPLNLRLHKTHKHRLLTNAKWMLVNHIFHEVTVHYWTHIFISAEEKNIN